MDQNSPAEYSPNSLWPRLKNLFLASLPLAVTGFRAGSLFLIFLVALVSGLLVLSGVGEIDARRYYRTLLQEQIALKQADVAAVAAKTIPLTIEGYGVDELQSHISDLQSGLMSLRQLSESGAVVAAHTLQGVQLRFTEQKYSASVIRESKIDEVLSALGYVPSVLRDDSILAGVVVLSSIFGTCLAALRGRRPRFTELAAGSVAGILVFCLIKGGKVFFMLGEDSQWVQYNPYSFAFAGILAGLFSESAFNSLTTATESMLRRFADAPKRPDAATEPDRK